MTYWNRRIVCMAFCLGTIFVSSWASAGTRGHYSYVHGKRYASTIPDDRLSKTPEWKDSDENPPLSARKAITLADKKRNELVKDSAKFKWHRESVAIVFDEFHNRCYWEITYVLRFRGGGGSTGPPIDLRLYVLMDGTLVEPVVSDEDSEIPASK